MRLVSLIVTKTSVELQRMIQGVGIDRGDKIYYEDFELFFYQLFSEMDGKQQYLRLYYQENSRVSCKLVKLKSASAKGNSKSSYGYSNFTVQQCNLI